MNSAVHRRSSLYTAYPHVYRLVSFKNYTFFHKSTRLITIIIIIFITYIYIYDKLEINMLINFGGSIYAYHN